MRNSDRADGRCIDLCHAICTGHERCSTEGEKSYADTSPENAEGEDTHACASRTGLDKDTQNNESCCNILSDTHKMKIISCFIRDIQSFLVTSQPCSLRSRRLKCLTLLIEMSSCESRSLSLVCHTSSIHTFDLQPLLWRVHRFWLSTSPVPLTGHLRALCKASPLCHKLQTQKRVVLRASRISPVELLCHLFPSGPSNRITILM